MPAVPGLPSDAVPIGTPFPPSRAMRKSQIPNSPHANTVCVSEWVRPMLCKSHHALTHSLTYSITHSFTTNSGTECVPCLPACLPYRACRSSQYASHLRWIMYGDTSATRFDNKSSQVKSSQLCSARLDQAQASVTALLHHHGPWLDSSGIMGE